MVNRELLHDFVVEGVGDFPWDMLRFDECWPQRIEDAALMPKDANHSKALSSRTRRRIAMRSIKPPTPARWTSFGWIVINPEFD